MTRRSTETGLAARRGGVAGGFTLIELLVVITLIGVLAAMAAPRFGRAIQQVKDDIAVTNLRGIWAAERYHWIYSDPHVYADKATLVNEKLVNDDVARTDGPYVYDVQSYGSTFTATAVRAADGTGFRLDSQTGQVTTLDGKTVSLPY